MNQLIQRTGIERFIRDVGNNIEPGSEILLRVEVERATMPVVQTDGSVIQVDFLRSITYQLYGTEISHRNKLFELTIGVERPNDPDSPINFNPDSIEFFSLLAEYTDMERVADNFDPQFSSDE